MAEVYIHWRWCILAIITFMALYSPCNAKIQLQKPNLDPDVYCAGHRLGDARHNFVLQPDYQLTPWHDLREGDVFLPLYTNHHFNETEEHLTSAVVFVHGALANADHYWCEAMIAAHMKGDRKDMLVVAPMFGYQQIRGDQWEIMPEYLQKKVKNDASIWFNATCWLQGCNSYDNPANYTSSFDALDQLINTISNTTLFPHIKRVTLVGFSAGGQMINRYAFASLVGATSTLKIRFIVANAGTHLYLNTHRPVESCRLEYDTGSDWSCDTYEVPTKPYLSNVTYTPASPEDMHTQKCEGPWEGYHFDPSSLPVQSYIYLRKFARIGLLDEEEQKYLNLYGKKPRPDYIHETNENTDSNMNGDVLDQDAETIPLEGNDSAHLMGSDHEIQDAYDLDGRRLTPMDRLNTVLINEHIDYMRKKDIRFIFGRRDSCKCNHYHHNADYCFRKDLSMFPNVSECAPSLYGPTCCDTYPDAPDNVMSVACGAEMQGANRLQRGLLYVHYLNWLWKDSGYKATYEVIDNGHNATACFQSEVFWDWAFTDSIPMEGDEVSLPSDSWNRLALIAVSVVFVVIAFLGLGIVCALQSRVQTTETFMFIDGAYELSEKTLNDYEGQYAGIVSLAMRGMANRCSHVQIASVASIATPFKVQPIDHMSETQSSSSVGQESPYQSRHAQYGSV